MFLKLPDDPDEHLSTLSVAVYNSYIALLTYSEDAATVTFFANVVAIGHQLDGALDERESGELLALLCGVCTVQWIFCNLSEETKGRERLIGESLCRTLPVVHGPNFTCMLSGTSTT